MAQSKQVDYTQIKALLSALADDMQEFMLGSDSLYDGDEDSDGCFDLYEYLRHDYKVLGSGRYSIVVACPWDNTKAIKIGHGLDGNGDIIQDGWLSWAAFCMKMHSEGGVYKHLPQIHNIVFRDYTFVALIDKYHCTWADRESSVFSGLIQALDVKKSYADLSSAMKLAESGVYSIQHTIDPLTGNMLEWLEHPMCPKLSDTHGGNFMIDTNNSCVVLNDPCSDDYLLKDRRISSFARMGVDVSVFIDDYTTLHGSIDHAED